MVGTETRTISAPTSSRRWICATVASTSQVSVLVMLCTEIGASPPTGTLPTQILRDWRRLIGDSECMVSLLSELEARCLAAHVRGEVYSFAVVTELGAASVAQMYVQWCLATDRPTGSGLSQRAEQHASVGITDPRPAVGG